MAGVFTVLPSSVFDYNLTTVNDQRIAQNLQGGVIELTAGKMLGGSSALDHMIHVHGDPPDYDNWATILGDDSWSYKNIQQYLKQQEKLTDPELLTSEFASLHGTDGPIRIRKQSSSANDNLLAAFKELGHNVVDDTTSTTSSLGATEPLLEIDDQVQQSNAETYLGEAKSRSNLCVALHITVTKILIENNVAVGVEVVDSNGDHSKLYAKKEVLVSAGGLNSPKILRLSGIGPRLHLESLVIDVIADLPVGENFQDHPSAVLFYQLEQDTSATPKANPYKFPVPTTCLYATLNSEQTYPDYQSINLLFPHDSTATVQLCSNIFKYSDDVCNKWFAASAGRNTLFSVHNLMIPKSRGKLELASADYRDDPLVYTGTYSDSEGADLALMTKALADFNKLTTTTYFKSVNGALVDLGFCSDKKTESEFWECYALSMSATMWHYMGT
ncbi:unnamed protein product [Arctia plantaginis]|uniref:Uncharacterized protein n=1 Tax=Arctia plantaginis TaxID=874455 RepID=A0A8S1AKG7_ARCPL|nr:unnamed protein product [Arctia plantaginis]CAB3247313.1 unnamed protein product [Arctia plantaginis]